MTWDELCKLTGFNFGSQSISISNDVSRHTISFYKSGVVWVSNSRGGMRLFKNCPYDLMWQMFLQAVNELKGAKNE